MTLNKLRQVVTPSKPLSRVLVVSKLTKYMLALEGQDDETLNLIKASDQSAVGIVQAHEQHLDSLKLVLNALSKRNIPFQHIRVDAYTTMKKPSAYDLIVAVGGDGTVIDVARRVRRIPLVAVNSAPDTSHGHFCLAIPTTFATVLDDIVSGKLRPLKIQRLQAYINSSPVGNPALNEVSMESASGSSSYILRINGGQESQLSDGIMFATAAGSTAWIRNYGQPTVRYLTPSGETLFLSPYDFRIMDVLERKQQYLVRAAFQDPDKTALRLLSGTIDNAHKVEVVSKMTEATVAVDGRRNSFPFPRGSLLEVRPSRHDLRLFVDPDCNDRYRPNVQVDRQSAA